MTEKDAIYVLLIEDSPLHAKVVQKILDDAEGESFKVTHSEDFSAGCDQLEKNQFDIVLLDLTLPDSRGLDTFTRLQEHSSEIPIVVLSGLDDKTIAIHAVQQGAQDYIVKGDIDGELMVRAIHYAIERKKMELKLKSTLVEVRRSNEELEQFAYVASHDLQEPLRMVTNYVQLLEKRYKDKLDEDAREFIAFAVDGAMRMQRLIKDLLSFSRVGTKGKVFEPVQAEEVLERVCRNLEMIIEETGANVTHDPLPEIKADDMQMLQLLQNLIVNAIKFRGDQVPQVHISAEKKERSWLFSIKDNGIGIDKKYTDRIFKIFQRLHTREEYSGTGIGLAVCKRIVERHGGTIWLESEPGKGTTFFFTISSEM